MRTKHDRKLWNEHVKLTATLFNAIAIGVLGVALIGPLARPDDPTRNADGSDRAVGVVELPPRPSVLQAINWNSIIVAGLLHVMAHVMLRGQVDEDAES